MNSARHAHGIPITTLDAWTAARIRFKGAVASRLIRQELECSKTQALHRTLGWVLEHSTFYRERLAGIDLKAVHASSGLGTLPFTTEADVHERGRDMVCVAQDDVARIVTLHSSGTTGPAKRLRYSAADLELTLDFFHHGMQGVTVPGETTLILLPGPTPDSTGDLLARALARMGATGVVDGLVVNAEQALARLDQMRPHCVVGFPVQLLMAARLSEAKGMLVQVPSVLLCSDYIPDSIVRELERIWGSKVYSHYGTVETGLGGGVECEARNGCHLRELDLLVEIVDPDTGGNLDPGVWGEVVVTTLGREAMPLIRYRTGDLGRILPGECKCGSCLTRLDKVQGRLACMPRMANGRRLNLARLDEVLFGLPGLLDYKVVFFPGKERETLRLDLSALQGYGHDLEQAVREHLAGLPDVRDTDQGPGPGVDRVNVLPWSPRPLHVAKRSITIREPNDEFFE